MTVSLFRVLVDPHSKYDVNETQHVYRLSIVTVKSTEKKSKGHFLFWKYACNGDIKTSLSSIKGITDLRLYYTELHLWK